MATGLGVLINKTSSQFPIFIYQPSIAQYTTSNGAASDVVLEIVAIDKIGHSSFFFLQMVGKNIHITNVCPGPIKTAVSENALTSAGTKFGVTDSMIAQGMSADRYIMCVCLCVCVSVYRVCLKGALKYFILLLY